MAVTPDSPAASSTILSVSPDGKRSLRLERDVVLLSETQQGLQSSETSKTVMILLAMLHGITKNTTSGDVLYLAIHEAQDICLAAGITEEEFQEVVQKFAIYQKKVRSWNPLAF